MCGTWIVDLLHWFGCYPISFPCALTRVVDCGISPGLCMGLLSSSKSWTFWIRWCGGSRLAQIFFVQQMRPWDFSFLQNQNHVRMPALRVLQQRKRKLQRLSPGHLATSCASKQENGLAIIKWRSFVTQLLHRYVLWGDQSHFSFIFFSLDWKNTP